jgi:hypothetical protein
VPNGHAAPGISTAIPTAPAATPVSLPPRPVVAENRTPWGWIALALLIPSALLGTVGVFVTTCQGKPEPTAMVAAPALSPPSVVPAALPSAGTTTSVVAHDKPPLEPAQVERVSPPEPSRAPAARVEPTEPRAPVAEPPAAELARTMDDGRERQVRMREPRVVGRDVRAEDVHALFAARRAALSRCRETEDTVAHVSLHVANGRIGLARSNPNVAGSDTEAARCVANVLREGPPPSGHGILMLEVVLPAR